MSTPVNNPRIIPSGVQLTVRLQQGTQTAAMVVGAVNSAGEIASGTGAAWLQHFWTSFRPVIVGSVSCTGATFRNVGIEDGPSFDLGPPTTPTGGGSGTSTVAAAAYLVRWRTARGGRSGRGRMFIPGVSTGAVGTDFRSVGTAEQALVNTAVTNYLAGFTSGPVPELDPAVLSFTKGFASLVLSGSCSPTLGIQRRRMRA